MPDVNLGFVHRYIPPADKASSVTRHDPIVTPEETMRVEMLFRECGAEVFLQWQPRGHEMGQEEVSAAGEWLAGWMERNGHLSHRE